MENQIGFTELLEQVFLNKYFRNNSSITEEGYELILDSLQDTMEFKNINLLIGILSTFAYGQAPKKLKDRIKKIVIQNKDFIISKIDEFDKKLDGTLNVDISSTLESIMNMEVSFSLLNSLQYSSRSYLLYKKRYFYGLKDLLIYLAEYCYDEFEKWFLSTKSKNLKIIFVNEILSAEYHYEYIENKRYLESKIDFLRASTKMIYFTEKNLYFDTQKTIFDLEKNEENIHFLIFYINKYYHYLDEENRNNFYVEVENLKGYLEYLTPSIFDEFINKIQIEVLYGIVSKIENQGLRNSLYEKILNRLDKDIASFNRVSINELDSADFYGNILYKIGEDEKIKKITKNFNKIFYQLNEPYAFYKYGKEWKKFLKQLLYYLKVISIFYTSKNNDVLEYKEKVKLVMREFDFYYKKDFDDFFEKII